MGYYIECPKRIEKATQLVRMYGAQVVAELVFNKIPEDKAVIVVVDNLTFEAAGLAYNEAEFKAFTNPNDRRRKTLLLMDKKLAHELSGFN